MAAVQFTNTAETEMTQLPQPSSLVSPPPAGRNTSPNGGLKQHTIIPGASPMTNVPDEFLSPTSRVTKLRSSGDNRLGNVVIQAVKQNALQALEQSDMTSIPKLGGNERAFLDATAAHSNLDPEQLHNVNSNGKSLLRSFFSEAQRHNVTMAFGLAVTGLLGFVVENEVRHYSVVAPHGEQAIPSDYSTSIAGLLIFLQCITTVSTPVLIWYLYRYYKIKYYLWLMDGAVTPKELFSQTPLFRSLLLECVVCAFHIPPGWYSTFETYCVDTQWAWYSVRMLNLWLFARLYLGMRFLRIMSRTRRTSARLISQMYDMDSSSERLLAVKDLLFNHSMATVGGMYLSAMVVFAYFIMVFERPVDHTAHFYTETTYGVAFWYVWVIMTTVGLGDWFPLSHFGRVFSIFISVAGLILTALLITTVSKMLDITVVEEKILTALNKVELRKSVNAEAVTLIQVWYRYTRNPDAYRRQFSARIRRWRLFQQKLSAAQSTAEANVMPILAHIQAQLSQLMAPSATGGFGLGDGSGIGGGGGNRSVDRQDVIQMTKQQQVLADQVQRMAEQQQRTVGLIKDLEEKISQMEPLRRGLLGPFMAS